MRWYASLRRTSEIAFVRRKGARAVAQTLVGHAVTGREVTPRIAITVSKAVGGAVVRNRVKRRIKGALDAMPALRVGGRIVLVASPASAEAGYDRLARDLGDVVARLRPG